MRPVATTQSALRAPLNTLLGTEANVRILRVLSLNGTAMGQSELARQTGLNLSGVGRVLGSLEEMGVLEFAGRAVLLREQHPLASALRSLFQQERQRFEETLGRLAEVCSHLPGPPMSAWVEGPVAGGHDVIGDPLVLGLLVQTARTEEVLEALAVPIDALSEEMDLTIECKVITRADLQAMRGDYLDQLSEALIVFGPPPTLLTGRRKKTATRKHHREVDADALERAEAVAQLIKKDPGVVERARRFVQMRLTTASAPERRDLAEWERLLKSSSLPRLRRALVANTERGARLRQSMPFFTVLNPGEQLEVATHRRRMKA